MKPQKVITLCRLLISFKGHSMEIQVNLNCVVFRGLHFDLRLFGLQTLNQ